MSSVRSRLEAAQGISTVPEGSVVLTAEGIVPVQEQDPSMPGVPTVAAPTTALVPADAPIEAPVPEVVPAPIVAELPELRHEWQPTDENGKPIGGLQVIIYRTEQEKFEKMQEKSVLLLRQLRKERREKALGVAETPADDAERFQNVTEFKPRELTSEERFQISQGIANPETFAAASDQLIEAAFGAKKEKVASTLNEMERFIIQQRAVQNYIQFINSSDFIDTPENRELVTGWIGTRNLAPTVANFQIASTRLKEAGLLQEAPAVQQVVVAPTPAASVAAPVAPSVEPNPQVPATASPALGTTEPQAKRHSHVPSGLNASVASPAGSTISAAGSSLTLADIDKMSSDEYKRRLKTPGFAALVDKLEADATARRRQKALGQVN